MFTSSGHGDLRSLVLGRLRAPGATWAPALLALATCVAFWRSFVATAPLLGVDSPAGLIPVVPLLALWLATVSTRRRLRAGLPLTGAREGVIDVPVAAALLGSAAWLVWRAPEEHGWYFWSERQDLLAAALFAVGLAVVLWGVQTVVWHKWVVLYAFLIWPAALVWLQEVIATPLAAWSALLARPLALAAGAQLAPVGGDPRLFAGVGAFPFALLVGDVCAGLNAAVTVALVSVPGAVQLGLPWRRAVPWALGGVLLALAGNVLRVAVLVAAADRFGPAVALGTVHPVLGALLLTAVFGVLWVCALVLAVPRRGGATPGGGAGRGAIAPASLRTICLVAAATAAFATASARLGAFEPLPALGPPGGAVDDPLQYLRLPPNWRIESQGEQHFQNLFGADSRSSWMVLRSSDGAAVMAQVITTPDRSRLQAYGPEACRIYHGGTVVGQRTVPLDAGGVARLIDTQDRSARARDEGPRLSVLYWEAPFLLRERQVHARVSLIGYEADEDRFPSVSRPGIAPGGPAFDRAGSILVDLAGAIMRETVASASPAVSAGA
jgi:exosortase/archaeosortase family protein